MNEILEHKRELVQHIQNSFEKAGLPEGTIKDWKSGKVIKRGGKWYPYKEGEKKKIKKEKEKINSFSKLEKILKNKLKDYKFRIVKTYGGDTLDFSYNSPLIDSSFSIQKRDLDKPDNYFVDLCSKIIILGESLADLRATYQTTSTRRIKTQTKKTIKWVKSEEEVIKLLNKHLKKIEINNY